MATRKVSPQTKVPSSRECVDVRRIASIAYKLTLVGTTGLYLHKMSQKAQRDLLLGGKKKTAAEKQKIKHDPIQEFRSSMYFSKERFADAAISFPSMAIKRALRTIAVEVEGVKGTQIDRLIYMPDEYIKIVGTPILRMDITRSSDIGRTPDVRTRAYLPTWGTQFILHAATPQFNISTIQTLLANAGQFIGIGDNRQERGKGNFGTFMVTEELPGNLSLDGNKERQIEAWDHPSVDELHGDTSELLALWGKEVRNRV